MPFAISTTASATDCRAYANKAVEQYEEWARLGCTGGGVPAHYWQSNWNVHHDWCNRRVATPPRAGGPLPAQGNNQRESALAACRAKSRARIDGGGTNEARCNEYAQIGIAQYRLYRSRKCKGGNPGWWTDDFNKHYKWCLYQLLTGKATVVAAGTNNRQKVLNDCNVAQGCNWIDISVQGPSNTQNTCQAKCKNIIGCRRARYSGPPKHGCSLCMN
ncbi:MAG: hypothetical protein ACR2PO_04030 [Methyloligellaceae bacterium]